MRQCNVPVCAAWITGAPTNRAIAGAIPVAVAEFEFSSCSKIFFGCHDGILHHADPPTTTSTRPRSLLAVCERMNSQHTAAPAARPSPRSMTPSSSPPM